MCEPMLFTFLPSCLPSYYQLPSVSHLTYGGAGVRKWRSNQNTWYPADDEKAPHPTTSLTQRSQCQENLSSRECCHSAGWKAPGQEGGGAESSELRHFAGTGPYSINGVPLRRVNPAYVLNTSTKVSLEGVNGNIDDSFFKKHKKFTGADLKKASEARSKKVEEAKEMTTKWREEGQERVEGRGWESSPQHQSCRIFDNLSWHSLHPLCKQSTP